MRPTDVSTALIRLERLRVLAENLEGLQRLSELWPCSDDIEAKAAEVYDDLLDEIEITEKTICAKSTELLK